MDNIYTQLVTTYKTVQYRSMNFVAGMSGILALLMVLFLQIITAIVLIIVAVSAFYFKRYLYVEYEYKFDNGNINVHKIINKSIRKAIISFNMKDIEMLAPEMSKDLKTLASVPRKKINAYPVTSRAGIYVALLKLDNERVKLRFVPDEKFIELCFKYNRNNVKKQ